MGAFNYKAMDKEGHEQKGAMMADSVHQLRQQLRSRGLIPLEIVAVTQSSLKWSFFVNRYHRRLSTAELTLITRQMATLLAAGLPIDEVVNTVSLQTDKATTKSILQAVRARLMEGQSLGNAFAEFPESFSELYRATIAAGEMGGRLDLVLLRLADYLERQEKVRQKISNALIYPAIMTTVALSIVTFLLIYVVPQMIGVFNQMGQQLPWATVTLLGISDFLKNNGLYVLLFILLIMIVVTRLLHVERIRLHYHRYLLMLPFLQRPIKMVNTARFARTFGILLAASVPVLDAMRIASQLITNLAIRASLQNANHAVREGGSIARALEQTGYFPAISVQLIATGEASSQLEKMLERAAYQQEESVTQLIDTLLSLFEPALILLMGLVVLFIVMAILLPIFEINQFIS